MLAMLPACMASCLGEYSCFTPLLLLGCDRAAVTTVGVCDMPGLQDELPNAEAAVESCIIIPVRRSDCLIDMLTTHCATCPCHSHGSLSRVALLRGVPTPLLSACAAVVMSRPRDHLHVFMYQRVCCRCVCAQGRRGAHAVVDDGDSVSADDSGEDGEGLMFRMSPDLKPVRRRSQGTDSRDRSDSSSSSSSSSGSSSGSGSGSDSDSGTSRSGSDSGSDSGGSSRRSRSRGSNSSGELVTGRLGYGGRRSPLPLPHTAGVTLSPGRSLGHAARDTATATSTTAATAAAAAPLLSALPMPPPPLPATTVATSVTTSGDATPMSLASFSSASTAIDGGLASPAAKPEQAGGELALRCAVMRRAPHGACVVPRRVVVATLRCIVVCDPPPSSLIPAADCTPPLHCNFWCRCPPPSGRSPRCVQLR